MAKLTALQVTNLKAPGRYTDENGLALVIAPDGSRKWVLRIQADGKRRNFGLGSAATVSLANARKAADVIREQVRAGIDPIEAREAAKAEREAIPTFAAAAKLVHEANKPTWKNAKHGAQWLASLETHAFPALGDKLVSDITGPMIHDCLAQIWLVVPETARRVRQRIGMVLDWSHSKGWRSSEAPMRAASRGLPKQPRKDQHFAAMAWEKVPGFLTELRETKHAGEVVRLAIEFTILTAARSGEVRGATWAEIDTEAKEWRIPAARMKASRAHTVPLTDRAIEILKRMAELRTSEKAETLVFPGGKRDRPLSDMALTMALRRMGAGVTVHGFRSSFRDWAAESTNFAREVCEAALAHALESRVEAAYRRSDLLEKRRALMTAWSGYCAGGTAKVLPMARRAG